MHLQLKLGEGRSNYIPLIINSEDIKENSLVRPPVCHGSENNIDSLYSVFLLLDCYKFFCVTTPKTRLKNRFLP